MLDVCAGGVKSDGVSGGVDEMLDGGVGLRLRLRLYLKSDSE